RNVARYWTVTNSNAGFGSYRATFSFVPGDITDPLANPTNFIVAKLDGTNWALPTIVARTSTNIQAAGMNNFSDFAVGERLGTNVPTIIAQPQSQRVNVGSNATFSVTAT